MLDRRPHGWLGLLSARVWQWRVAEVSDRSYALREAGGPVAVGAREP